MSDKVNHLESAIPAYLKVERQRALGIDDDYVPSTASFSARFDEHVNTLIMAFFGVQFQQQNAASKAAFKRIVEAYQGDNGPAFWDEAFYNDEAGYTNHVFVGYWRDVVTFQQWQDALPVDWWYRFVNESDQVGVFCELYTPNIRDTETTFSHPVPEGYSRIADKMSGKVREHGYWGSARDRIPRTQTESLEAVGQPLIKQKDIVNKVDTFGRLVSVIPHENLCLLRSGQDWTDTESSERSFYFDTIVPPLEKGMNEIVEQGLSLGCFFNRYMKVAKKGCKPSKTYSLSAWHSLSAIESWVKKETHLAIFRAGTKHYKTIGDDARLKLYHEMSVVHAKDQSFDYFNCHPSTGMLKAAFASK